MLYPAELRARLSPIHSTIAAFQAGRQSEIKGRQSRSRRRGVLGGLLVHGFLRGEERGGTMGRRPVDLSA